jgi:hypothetical protein
LGFDLSWKKGQCSTSVEWIGALFKPWFTPSGKFGVSVSIPAEKMERIRAAIEKFLGGSPEIVKIELRCFAGLVAWVANLCPQLNPFLRMVWAALTANADSSTVYVKQVKMPLSWLLAFTKSVQGPLQRNFRPRATTMTIITFDGSPFGGGATIQIALPIRADRSRSPVSFYWRSRWTHAGEKLLAAQIGEAASQAKWEAFALLLAVIAWLPILSVMESQLVFCGDALGILADALKLRAKEPVLNRIMAELALAIAPFGFETSTVHVWSCHNDVCDQLSRAEADSSVPASLVNAGLTPDRRPAFAVL